MSEETHDDLEASKPVRREEREMWPYARWEYAARFLWGIVWHTLWQVCWHRIPLLRSLILRLFGTRADSTLHIAGSVRIIRPWELSFGQHCEVGPRTHLYNLGGLVIGNEVLISQDVYICGGTHDHTDPTYPLVRRKIVIEDYVWIAAGAFIGPGVRIGQGAVVGARAVVTRDVEPWTIVAGNPAKVVKQRQMRGLPHEASAS